MSTIVPFTPRVAWPEFHLEDSIPKWMHPEAIVSINSRGVRYGIWPFYIEVYAGFNEPDLDYSRSHGTPHNRLLMWRYYDTKKVSSKNWRVYGKSDGRIGYCPVPENGLVDIHWLV